jgi:hypothetical protein
MENDSDLVDLVDDAFRVARYGVRTGRFADDALFTALQAVKSSGVSWSNTAIVDLQRALNQAISAIHPVTLADLRNWDPFAKPASPSRLRKVGKFAFMGAAVGLMLMCGYYTIWQKKATSLLAEIAATEALPQDRLVNELVFFAGGGAEDEVGQTLPSIPVSDKVDELRAINDRKELNRAAFNELRISSIVLQSQVNRVAGTLMKVFSGGAGAANAAADPKGGKAGDKPNTVSRPPSNCEPGPKPTSAVTTLVSLQGNVTNRDDLRRQVYCIASINWPQNDPATSPAMMQAVLTSWIDVLGLWLLPGLYGALGAMMYFMRNFLDPLLPEPGVMKVILRVCMGMFAGVSVAWVWAPSSLIQGIGITDVSVAALTLAFLVGFGIEVFFALLDRLVTMISGTINKGDPPAATS